MVAVPRAPEALAALVLKGDRRAIARAISWIEDEDGSAGLLVSALWPHVGRATVIGITGPPGAGKSTLVGALVRRLRAIGHSVGVVAVDPSSPFTQGALLGDRVRLVEHDVDEGVFFRSMGSRGRLGGIAEGTALAAAVLDAAGFEIVLIETVGAGQSDIRIADLVDVVVLALQPGSGDSVQAIKAGLMEIPDVVALTKCDLPGVDAFRSELRLALSTGLEQAPALVEVVARSNQGINELWQAIVDRRAELGEHGVRTRRRAGLERELLAGVAARAGVRAERAVVNDPLLQEAIAAMHAGKLDPLALADQIDSATGGRA